MQTFKVAGAPETKWLGNIVKPVKAISDAGSYRPQDLFHELILLK
jgi:hypothetical protein